MDEDLKDVAAILNALRRTARNPASYGKPLHEVDREFSEALEDEVSRQAKEQYGRLARAHRATQSALSALRPPKTRQELLDRLKEACGLTDRQVQLLKDTGLVATDSDGRPMIRKGPDVILTPERANIYVGIIGCLGGMAIWSILLDPAPGIWLVSRGLGLGLAIGSTAGFVLGRSFRAYPLIAKIESFAPWANVRAERTA